MRVCRFARFDHPGADRFVFGVNPRLAPEAIRDADDHERRPLAVDPLQCKVAIGPGDQVLEPFVEEDVVRAERLFNRFRNCDTRSRCSPAKENATRNLSGSARTVRCGTVL